MKKIVVIGSINMDIVNRVHAHPLPGETVLGLDLQYSPGGKGANQAVASARAGSHVTMVGSVGNDMFSKKLIDNLSANRVRTSFIRKANGPTSLAIITVDDQGENAIIVTPGANQTFSANNLSDVFTDDFVKEVDTVILQNEIPLETTLKAIELAHHNGIQVIFNPAPISHITLEHFQHVDIVILNETEAEVLTGVKMVYECTEKELHDAFRNLLATGPEAVILTMGELGAIYGTFHTIENEQPIPEHSIFKFEDGLTLIQVDAFKVKVADTTAAGDTFVGAFSSMYHTPSDAWEALQFATAAAALAVMKEGAQDAAPCKADILHFLAKRTEKHGK